MAIQLRAVGTSPGANSSTCVITKPSGIAVGDFLIAHVKSKASGTIAWSTGGDGNWNALGSQQATASGVSALFYKFATSGDVSATTFSFSVGSSRNKGEMSAWTGVDTTSPVNTVSQQANTAGTSIAVPQITPTVDGCTILIIS